MSLNMFPNAGNPSLTENMEDRTLPRGNATGEGPYGSFNDDEKGELGDIENPIRDLGLNDSDHPPKYATVTDTLFTEDQTQGILDDAFERSKMLMNPLITKAIKLRLTQGQLNQLAYEWADDLLETSVYETLIDRDIDFDIKTLSPVGLVSFLDHFMTQQTGRSAQLEELLKVAYSTYLSSKNQIG
jgi:hypothetical protein